MSFRRRLLTLLAALATVFPALGAFAGPLPATTGPPANAFRLPKLAVIISVDGLSWDRLAGYRPYFTDGLRRLLDEGHVEQEARYRHLNTVTAPGHASLGTGAPPRVTGIVGNLWYGPKADGTLGEVSCTGQTVADAKTGEQTVIQGPGNLRIPTLGDRLVDKYSGSRVVAISGKDRGSIFLAGRNPHHAVYWFDTETGRFKSSAAYDTKSPAGSVVSGIVARYNKSRAGGWLPGRFGLTWKKLTTPVPAGVDERTERPGPSAEMAQYQLPVLGLGWDHDLTKSYAGYFGGIFSSPFIDEMVADLAVEVLADKTLALGRRDDPDLLCLSFSGQDGVSHNYGPESEENLDLLRRLDVQIGRVLQELERVSPGGVVVAFSADHGFSPIPEASKRRVPGFKGGRVPVGTYANVPFLARLNRATDDALCLPDGAKPIFGVEGFNLRYDLPKLPMLRSVEGECGAAGRAVTREDVDRVLPGVVRRLWFEEFSGVLLSSQKDAWDPKNPAVEFARNAYDAERSGDAMLIPRPGVVMGWDPARGTSHGSHSEPDIHVPLIFWGAGIPRKVSAVPSAPYDLAPTLGALLGVAVPDAVGRALLTPK